MKIIVIEYAKSQLKLVSCIDFPEKTIVLLERVDDSTLLLGLREHSNQCSMQLWIVEIQCLTQELIQVIFVQKLSNNFTEQILSIGQNCISFKTNASIGFMVLNNWSVLLLEESVASLEDLVEISCYSIMLEQRQTPTLGFSSQNSKIPQRILELWLVTIELYYADFLQNHCDLDLYDVLSGDVPIYQSYIQLSCIFEYLIATQNGHLIPNCFSRLSNRGRLMESVMIRILESHLLRSNYQLKLSTVILSALLRVYGDRLNFNTPGFESHTSCRVCQIEHLAPAAITKNLKIDGRRVCGGCTRRFIMLCCLFCQEGPEFSKLLTSTNIVKTLATSPAGALTSKLNTQMHV
eukprot:Gregarina_sp_Poly_1__3445@NODE_19_length_21533_cov_161_091167_g17_i0_p8_GENE_NODE_19_length_21533_cov_161_091167_g17_i0NODE_19_length_21533_cov_161_091167_g17_i0_p8_ORF_typecomplete_len350_score27_28_NODE_19_length_21533_cov_161_091167_g17_i050306079